MGYIDDALSAGIPMEAIQNFLRSNPGDEHRLVSALAGAREQLQGRGLTNEQIYQMTGAGTPIAGITPIAASIANTQRSVDMMDRDLISFRTPQGWGDIIEGVGSRLPGPIGDIIEFLGPRLPLPGGPRPPQLPGGTPPVINIPPIPVGSGSTLAAKIARFLARVSPARLAKIAAIAAALGMTIEQYLASNPDAMKGGKRMNPLNPRALRRSIRRMNGFEKFVRRTYRVPKGAQFRTKKFKKGRGGQVRYPP